MIIILAALRSPRTSKGRSTGSVHLLLWLERALRARSSVDFMAPRSIVLFGTARRPTVASLVPRVPYK